MGKSESMYLRVPAELKEAIQRQQQPGQPLTDVAIEVLQDGLSWRATAQARAAGAQRVAELEMQLHAAQASTRWAERERDAARGQCAQLSEQLGMLQQWLAVPVAECKDCRTIATVSHVAMKQCPTTGQPALQGFELRPEYTGEKGAWEVLRDLSALVGAGVVLATAARRLEGASEST